MLAAIWNLYLGLLTLIGNTVLITIGIGLCGYATFQQLQPTHEAQQDVIMFVVGIVLIASRMIRRIIWTVSGLAVIWVPLVWFGAKMITAHDDSFQITQELIALAAAPPVLLTLFLEITRDRANDGPNLEITLSAPTEKDS